MTYINTKTGAVLETDCTIHGGNWQPKEKAQEKPKPQKPKKKTSKEA